MKFNLLEIKLFMKKVLNTLTAMAVVLGLTLASCGGEAASAEGTTDGVENAEGGEKKDCCKDGDKKECKDGDKKACAGKEECKGDKKHCEGMSKEECEKKCKAEGKECHKEGAEAHSCTEACGENCKAGEGHACTDECKDACAAKHEDSEASTETTEDSAD